jgi:hypothetical protein
MHVVTDHVEASLTLEDRNSYARLCARALAAGDRYEAEYWARKFTEYEQAFRAWADGRAESAHSIANGSADAADSAR